MDAEFLYNIWGDWPVPHSPLSLSWPASLCRGDWHWGCWSWCPAWPAAPWEASAQTVPSPAAVSTSHGAVREGEGCTFSCLCSTMLYAFDSAMEIRCASGDRLHRLYQLCHIATLKSYAMKKYHYTHILPALACISPALHSFSPKWTLWSWALYFSPPCHAPSVCTAVAV